MMGESEIFHKMLRVTKDKAEDINSSHLFAFYFSFHTLKEKKVQKIVCAKPSCTELSCFAKWERDCSAGLQHHADREEEESNTGGNFIPVIAALPYFPDGEMDSAVAINEKTYIKVRISTLSPSTALIPHC